jgi:hypothetical protein
MRLHPILAVLLLLWPAGARADGIYDNLMQFGMVGTWAIHCDQPLSPSNPRSVIFSATDGKTYRKLERGADNEDLYSVVESANVVTATTLDTSWRNAGGWTGSQAGLAIEMVIAKEGNRIRTIDSRGSDGSHFIQGGVIVKTGAQAVWMEKCQ